MVFLGVSQTDDRVGGTLFLALLSHSRLCNAVLFDTLVLENLGLVTDVVVAVKVWM